MKVSSAVVICTGKSKAKELPIKLPSSDRILTSDDFIGWINGQPGHRIINFDLSNCRTVGIIGNGNVALDVTRLFLKNPKRLCATDIASKALRALLNNGVDLVRIFGRRGALNVQAIFFY